MNANGLRGTLTGVHPGDERLAAFVDGRLASRDRKAVVEHLASCEECYEVFSETVRLQSESSEEDVSVSALPLTSARWQGWRRPVVWRRWVPALGLAAAAIAVLVVAPWNRFGGADLSLQALTSSIFGSRTATVASQRIDAYGWPQTLGPTSYGTDEVTAFRLGVLAVDLDVAAAADDRRTTTILSHRMAVLLAGLELGQIVAHEYYSGPRGVQGLLAHQKPSEAPLAAHREADAVLGGTSQDREGLVDPFWYTFGKWAEAGYLAAAAGEEDHFESAAHRRFLRRLADAPVPDHIEVAMEGVARVEWAEERSMEDLAQALWELIAVAGGGEAPSTLDG